MVKSANSAKGRREFGDHPRKKMTARRARRIAEKQGKVVRTTGMVTHDELQAFGQREGQ